MAENNLSIIRRIDDGIEFFTVELTGESGMSVSGLAILCGVSQVAITKLLKNLITKASSKWLKPFVGTDLYLVTDFKKRGGKVKVIKSKVCAAIIQHYALLGNEIAQDSLSRFNEEGIKSWIQSITGWNPQKASAKLLLADIVQREPNDWEEHFHQEWREQAERLSGWQWKWRVMSRFINKHVYNYMPQEVRNFLDEHNPADKNGQRPNKQHQHFKEEADKILKAHIEIVFQLMLASCSMHQFEQLMIARFSGTFQLELFAQK